MAAMTGNLPCLRMLRDEGAADLFRFDPHFELRDEGSCSTRGRRRAFKNIYPTAYGLFEFEFEFEYFINIEWFQITFYVACVLCY